MNVAEMKLFRLFLAIVLLSMFICPSLQASPRVVRQVGPTGCDHGQQKGAPQKTMTCCDQQAVQAKELRTADVFSLPADLTVTETFSLPQNSLAFFSPQISSQFAKMGDRLAELSLLRI